MKPDLTLENLLAAIRHFLTSPEVLNCANPSLTLNGVAGDDTMKAIFEARGGKLVITVNEIPEQIADLIPEAPEVAFNAYDALWHPDEDKPADTAELKEVEEKQRKMRELTVNDQVLTENELQRKRHGEMMVACYNSWVERFDPNV